MKTWLNENLINAFVKIPITLALIALSAFALWAYWRTVSNHLNHNTEVLNRLVGVQIKQEEVLRGISEGQKEVNKNIQANTLFLQTIFNRR